LGRNRTIMGLKSIKNKVTSWLIGTSRNRTIMGLKSIMGIVGALSRAVAIEPLWD